MTSAKIAARPDDDPIAWVEDELLVLLAGKAAERLAVQGSEPGFRRTRRQLERLAFHESGHAIAAAACGRAVYGLTVIPDRLCQVGMAGYISGGQCRQGPEAVDPNPGPANQRPAAAIETDYHRAARLALAVSPGLPGLPPRWKQALAVIHEFKVKAEAVLQANWWLLQKLAWSLEERGTLEQNEIAALIGIGRG